MNNTISNTNTLSFADALQQEQTAAHDYDHEKWLYVPCCDTDHRYILGTKGARPLICIGLNPSTATPDKPDRTLQSVQRIAAANGYDSFILCNVYAQRATSPDDLDKERNAALHAENMRAFEWALQQVGDSPAIWAAWGTHVDDHGYLTDSVREMIEIAGRYDAKWYIAGKRSAAKGHPHHPLYLPKDSELVRFTDIEEYLQSL